MAPTASAAPISPDQNAAARRGRRTQPLDRQNEENDGDDVREIDELLDARVRS